MVFIDIQNASDIISHAFFIFFFPYNILNWFKSFLSRHRFSLIVGKSMKMKYLIFVMFNAHFYIFSSICANHWHYITWMLIFYVIFPNKIMHKLK